MTVILWVYAVAGFWPVPSFEGHAYLDADVCEQARLQVEQKLREQGYTGIFTVCRPQQ